MDGWSSLLREGTLVGVFSRPPVHQAPFSAKSPTSRSLASSSVNGVSSTGAGTGTGSRGLLVSGVRLLAASGTCLELTLSRRVTKELVIHEWELKQSIK